MSETISGTLVDLWEGLGQGDSDHGNAPTYTVGWYLTEAEAIEAVRTAGAWGSPGKVDRVQVLKANSDNGSYDYYEIRYIEVSCVDLEKARERALAKLTADEKKLLGLK